MTPDRPLPDSESLRDPRVDAAWSALSREEPPAALDARILAAAHRAVGAGPQRAEVREATRPERWWWPLAAAASIGAVAFGVLQVLGPQPSDVPQTERAVVSDAPVQSPQSTPAAPPAAEPPRASAPVAPAAELRQRDTRADTAPALKQAPVTQPMPAAVPEPTAAAPPALAQDAATPKEAMGKAAVGGVAPPPAASPAAAAPAAAFRAEAQHAEAQRKTTAPLPIDEWLARIRKLRAEGRAEELAREIAAFRAAYPGEEKRLQEELARPLPPRE
jgi:hypothetical protein